MRIQWCLILSVCVLAVLASCGGPPKPDGAPEDKNDEVGVRAMELTSDGARFKIGPLPTGWRRLQELGGGEAKAAFTNRANDQAIMVNVSYAPNRRAGLIALRNHLLFDITDRKILEQSEIEVDKREGLWTVCTGYLDGAPIKMALVVARIDNWVYDLAYISPPSQFEHNLKDFKDFVKTLHQRRQDQEKE